MGGRLEVTGVHYSSGQIVPPNVLEAIRFTGKIGFLSRELWDECFGIGTKRWKNQQLQFLVERGVFRRHRNPIAKNHWVLNDRGIELLKLIKGAYVTPVQVTYLKHDGVVARSLMALKRERLIQDFHVERELKTYGVREFLLSDKDHDQKYPDAVIKIDAFGGKRMVAVEYERERKSSSRYKNILFQYAGLTQLAMVLFIVEADGTRIAIENSMKYLGQTALADKLAFVLAEDWQKSPLTAPISLKSGVIRLGEICTKMTM